MLFNSLVFWLFFAIVFGLYSVLSQRWQNRLLLVASYVFYGWWDTRFLSLILLSTVVDYAVGRKLASTEAPGSRKRWLLTSLVTNLGLLGVFKYFGFFAASARVCLETLGFTVQPWELEIVLPVGISFYTFQTLSYTIDVYRRRLEPTRAFLDFALFVAFFPQLVAGPIERAKTLLPQIQRKRRMSWKRWSEGALLVGLGLFKKVVVADFLGKIATQTFADPDQFTSGSLLAGLYCFSFQIYADFSGYSDIARGLARALGFDLMVNFEQPYFAASVTEFWRRWHISLSTWLRDYLYIPLGGNRAGEAKTYRNLMLTMLLGGLWHGASWTFVVWGGLHGLYLAAHKLLSRGKRPPAVPPKEGLRGALVYAFKCLAVFHLVALTWIFFRAQTFAGAWSYLLGLFSFRGAHDGDVVALGSAPLRVAAWSVLALLLLVDLPQYLRRSQTALLTWRTLPRVLAFTALLILSLSVAEGTVNEFIYFQF